MRIFDFDSVRGRNLFYQARPWRELRASVLDAEPLCRECAKQGRLTPARVVDHIEPLAKRPDLALDPENLQPLCGSCHSEKTAREETPRRGKGDFTELNLRYPPPK